MSRNSATTDFFCRRGGVRLTSTSGGHAMRKIIIAALLFAAAYALSLAGLSTQGDPGDALAVLVIYGLILGGLCWLATWRAAPFPLDLKQPGRQLALVLALTVLVILWLCFGVEAVDKLVPASIMGDPRGKAVVKLIEKLAVFVVIPWLLFQRLFGATAADFGLSHDRFKALGGRMGLAALGLSIVVMGINLVIGQAAAPIRNGEISAGVLAVAFPLCLLWNMVEVGLVEEFFFRALMQTRLAAVFKSQAIGAVTMAILFGLFHAPGLVLRGASAFEGMSEAPGPLYAMAYSVAVMGVAGIPFAILWARSRNLWLGMIVHAANDTVAYLPDFIDMWSR